MAETVLNVVAEEILGKLISLAAEQIGLAWGFEEERIQLRESVEMIQAVLADAEKRQVREESVRLWLRRLEKVAYDADDLLDELAYERLRRKVEIRNQMKRKKKKMDFSLPLLKTIFKTLPFKKKRSDMTHIPNIQKLSSYFVVVKQDGKELKCINVQKISGPVGASLRNLIHLEPLHHA